MPRLGAIRGTSSSSTTSGRIASAQTPVALTTWSARDLDPLARVGLDEGDPGAGARPPVTSTTSAPFSITAP